MGVSPWELAGIPGPPHFLWHQWAILTRNADAEVGPENDALSEFLNGGPS